MTDDRMAEPEQGGAADDGNVQDLTGYVQTLLQQMVCVGVFMYPYPHLTVTHSKTNSRA